MMECWAKLGMAALSIIINLSINNPSAAAVTDGFLKIFDILGDKYFEKRKLQRQCDAISDRIAESCNSILDYHSITEERKEAIIEDITKTISCVPISYSLIFEKKVRFEEFYRLFADASKPVVAHYDSREQELFERLLRHISNIIFDAVLQGPQFANQGVKEIFSCMDSLAERLDDILKKLSDIDKLVNTKEQELQNFDRAYRNAVKERYGWVRLFGANTIDRAEKKYALSIAYVRLEMSRYDEMSDLLTPSQLLDSSKTIWIEGNAGSGKTTFLQWLALASASNNVTETPQIKNTIPIMIELRSQNCRALSLPKAIEATMQETNFHMPENWLNRYLEAGKALILIDGVDEVKQEEREYVLDWIEEVRVKYKKTWIIITSRPYVYIDLQVRYKRVSILPMSSRRIDIFLDYWHKAVLIEKHCIPESEVEEIKRKLSLLISSSDSIRKLVSNPLLCAMICALNYKNGTILSTHRNDLYDDCCKLLLGSRDQAREIRTFEHFDLEYDEKRAILEHLAYWMMKNGLASAEKNDVLKCISRAKKSLRNESQQYADEVILNYFLERSGILRSPSVDQIDFIHKSFQEYLAASEIYREDDWGFIADKAFCIEWYETLILSIGFASTRKAKKVIDKILAAGSEESIVIAAACAENTSTLDPNLRKKIDTELKKILPPQNYDDCKRLANAGEYVIPLLTFNDEYARDQVYNCLVTLSFIDSEKILPVIGTYLQPFAEKRILECIEHIACSFYGPELESPDFANSDLAIAMKKYIIEMAKTGALAIPETFITSLAEIESEAEYQALRNITDLEIFNFVDICKDEYWKKLCNVQNLTVIGTYDSLDILYDFQRSLQSVTICDYSKECDVSSINRIPLPNLEKLYMHTGRKLYFDGDVVSNFKNLQDFGLYIYNNNSQIYLDHFSGLKKLKRLEIYAEFYWEIAFDEVISDSEIDELLVYVPYAYSLLEYDNFLSEIRNLQKEGKKPIIEIKEFGYPFGDELGKPSKYR